MLFAVKILYKAEIFMLFAVKILYTVFLIYFYYSVHFRLLQEMQKV